MHIRFDRVYKEVAYLVMPGHDGWATAAFLDRPGRIVPLVKFSKGQEPTASITAPAYLEWKMPVPATEFLSQDALQVAEVADALRVVSATRAFIIRRIGRVESLDVA